MTKTCHACNSEVPESHTGKCPLCGKQEGYQIVRSVNEFVKINDLVKTKFNELKINPKTISFSIDAILVKQKEIAKSLAPLAKIIVSPQIEILNKQLKDAAISTQNLQERLSNITVPTIVSATTQEEQVSDEVVDEVVDELEEIKEEVPKKENETKDIQNSLRDIQAQMHEQHTEQMAEHQKTRDELLMEVGSQKNEISNLKQEVKNGWKKPQNWIIGVAIGAVISILVAFI